MAVLCEVGRGAGGADAGVGEGGGGAGVFEGDAGGGLEADSGGGRGGLLVRGGMDGFGMGGVQWALCFLLVAPVLPCGVGDGGRVDGVGLLGGGCGGEEEDGG